MNVGIDLGISATKLILLDKDSFWGKEIWEDSFSEEKLADYLMRHGIAKSDVHRIALTGVGSDQFGNSLLGIPAIHVDEFDANARAARWLLRLVP